MWMLFSQFSHFALERELHSPWPSLKATNIEVGRVQKEDRENILSFSCLISGNVHYSWIISFCLICLFISFAPIEIKGVFLYLLKMNLDFNLTFAASAHLGLKASNFDAEKCGKMGLWCGKWPPNRRPNSRANSSVISTRTRHTTLCPQISVFLLENE